TTIYGLLSDPYASRSMIGNDNAEEVRSLLSKNIGSYTFQYMLAIVSPIFICIYRNSKNIWWLILTILTSISILYAQIVAIIMVYILNLGATLIILKFPYIKAYIITLIIGCLFFVYGKSGIAQLLFLSADHLTQLEMVESKLIEVANYLEANGNV